MKTFVVPFLLLSSFAQAEELASPEQLRAEAARYTEAADSLEIVQRPLETKFPNANLSSAAKRKKAEELIAQAEKLEKDNALAIKEVSTETGRARMK